MDGDWRVWAPNPKHPEQDDPLHYRQIGAARDRKGGRLALERYGLEIVSGAALRDAAAPIKNPASGEPAGSKHVNTQNVNAISPF